ncbi:MAG: cyclic nucleotide-binding domain-containing protein [Flavobacteriaceae bacterium]|nr:cyclic nucleotide-binding domain-containing protein [Flavobacteriaceae bacterium]
MKTSIDILNASGELSSKIVNEFKKGVRKISVRKGVIIQRQGELSVNTYFVISGLLKSYTIDEKGKEHIFMFAPENWVIGDIDAHVENSLSQLFIEAITLQT